MAENLGVIASQLAAPGKGLLASDESTGTIGKRLIKAGIENTAEERRRYRELFYTADIGNSISGVIMFSETLYQSSSDGTPFVQCLSDQGVLTGIKVDEGLSLITDDARAQEGETTTKGLETLAERCKEYKAQGASFAKWRAALKVGPNSPSAFAIEQNADQLAKYAAICQKAGLVPIVEPEILIDGAHDINAFHDASVATISTCIAHLWRNNVDLEGCLLKPQMVVAGADWTPSSSDQIKPTSEDIANHTLDVLRCCVPPAIPGIMFLSGGQSEVEATTNLNMINWMANVQGKTPWSLSFSFGRGLQASVLKLWSEDQSQPDRCRAMARDLANVNGEAALGKWDFKNHPSITSDDGDALSLREGFRGWRE